MPRPKKQSTSAPLNADISVSDLQKQIGHRIRRPLIHIIEQCDAMLSVNRPASSLETKAGLGLISGEAHQILDMYDWVLSLFELTLSPNSVTPLNPGQVITSVCLEIETEVSKDLLGYQLIWSVPDDLPTVSVNGHLLQRALHLMIRLVGTTLSAGYVQLDVQVSDQQLIIQASAITSDTTIAPIQPELESLILESIARAYGGRFTCSFVDSRLNLSIQLPIIRG